jgi:peptidoglycan/LPS O-acetylase OafA/YrhL
MNKRLTILDSLRGLAAVIVVIHHFLVFNGTSVSKNVSSSLWKTLSFISELNVEAVLFFFVLSGFCIALAQKGNLIATKAETNHYLYRRFKRILPIYWIALALALLVGILIKALSNPTYSWYNLLGNLAFFQTSIYATKYWVSPFGNNGPLWSLAYEMFFYLIFPVYSYLVIKVALLKPVLNQFCLLLAVAVLCIATNKLVVFIPHLAFLSYFLIWMVGFFAANYYLAHQKNDLFFSLIFAGCLVLLFFKNVFFSTALFEIIKGLFIGSLFYWALRLEKLWKLPLLNFLIVLINKVFNYLGHGSYALYAFHYPLLILMNYYGVTIAAQIAMVVLLALMCPQIETRLAGLKLFFLRRNYIKSGG